MIKINTKTNKKLAEHFPQDPFSDIAILTKNQRLRLVSAYISIDSGYFQKRVHPDVRQVNLSHLPEEPLIRVLRSLYGAELESRSVKDLNELYQVIEFLEIDDYRQNIIQEIKVHSSLMDSLELLEFAFKYDILVQKFKTHHFCSDLRVLEDNRNYLQLNRISASTINTLLIEYERSIGERGHRTINSILENYLNRNNTNAAQYFTETLEVLKNIWEKFHHTFNYVERIKNSDRIKASTLFGYDSKKSQTSSVSTVQDKKKIAFLEQQMDQKNKMIAKLREENLELKQLLNMEKSRTLTCSSQASLLTGPANSSVHTRATDLDNDFQVFTDTKTGKTPCALLDRSEELITTSYQIPLKYTKRFTTPVREVQNSSWVGIRTKKALV